MVMEGIAFGWILILAGVIMLLIEVYHPGFFIAVPGTVIIIFGMLSLAFPEIFYSTWIIVIGVISALGASAATVWLYSRITPDESPTTISRDSIAGKKGRVIKELDSDSISGKVVVDGVEWSARTEEGTIPVGRHVRILRSEGVHIIVSEEE